MGIVIGIDATRSKSGGGKTHLLGVLAAADPREHGIDRVHVWGYEKLLDDLPEYPWLTKHCPECTRLAIPSQLYWQRYSLTTEATTYQCNAILNTDAGTFSTFRPAATMSRDMLSFEKGEMQRYPWCKARLRLWLLWYAQAWSLRRADRAIFLTRYAAEVIQSQIGRLKNPKIIHHGIDDRFASCQRTRLPWPKCKERDIRLLYISNAALHKHQWHVVDAFKMLIDDGFANLSLELVGGGSGRAQSMLLRSIEKANSPKITLKPYVKHGEIPAILGGADVFIFASSCENMPNTLVESMASGLPIACSRRGPMPEILEDGGVYFDPENPASIAAAIKQILENNSLRTAIASRAEALSKNYTWERCASETWSCLKEISSCE